MSGHQIPGEPFENAENRPKTPLNVVMVYDDRTAGDHAMQLLNQVTVNLLRDITYHLWQFDLQDARAPSHLDEIDLSNTHLLIVSTGSQKMELTSAVQQWMTERLPVKSNERLAVAILYRDFGVLPPAPIFADRYGTKLGDNFLPP